MGIDKVKKHTPNYSKGVLWKLTNVNTYVSIYTHRLLYFSIFLILFFFFLENLGLSLYILLNVIVNTG